MLLRVGRRTAVVDHPGGDLPTLFLGLLGAGARVDRLPVQPVARQPPRADNGDMWAAMIDGEATVKTFKRRDGKVWLMPHNPAFAPIPGDEATILGRVVTVLRKL